MRGWMMAVEPTLEELLRDDIMVSVTRSAGIDVARRRPGERFRRPYGCLAGRALQPSAV